MEETLQLHTGDIYPVVCHLFITKVTSLMALYASTYNIVIITIERYLAVTRPFKFAPDVVSRRLPFVFIFIWGFCIAQHMFGPLATIIRSNHCLTGYRMLNTPLFYYYPAQCFVLSMAIPLLVMLFCYIRIFITLRSSEKISRLPSSKLTIQIQRKESRTQRAQRNILETCIIITLVYIICWFTNELGLILFVVGYYSDLSNKYYTIGHFLVLLNSCLNPYIYVVRYNDFQKQLRFLLYKNNENESSAVDTVEVSTIQHMKSNDK